MLAFLNLGLTEMLLILLVAILVFGRNLPSVAVQAAATVQKMRRSLVDLRREAGIDEELRRARREFEQAVPRDLPRLVERKLDAITADPPVHEGHEGREAREAHPIDPGAATPVQAPIPPAGDEGRTEPAADPDDRERPDLRGRS